MPLPDDPMQMSVAQQMVLAHYNQTWGLATEVLRYAFSDDPLDAPFVAEFQLGDDADPLYVYATIGMSDAPQPGTGGRVRAELFAYSSRPLPEFKQALAMLAIYPRHNGIALGPLDTIYGGRGIVDGSPLSSILLALPLREPEEFALIDLGEYQAQPLMVTPISEAERQFCADYEPLKLLSLFASQGVDVADLFRPSAV